MAAALGPGCKRGKRSQAPACTAVIAIDVAYPGASPAEVEQSVVLAIEEAVRGVAASRSVQSIRSMAREGAARIDVEFDLEATDTEVLLTEIAQAVGEIQSLPDDVERPVIQLPRRSRDVYGLAVTGPLAMPELVAIANGLRASLQMRSEIGRVDLLGDPDHQVIVEVRRDRLRAFGVTLDDVAAAIRGDSLDLPDGSLATPGGEVLVRARGAADARDAADLAAIPIRTTAGQLVRVGDIARIRDGYAEGGPQAFVGGAPAIAVVVYPHRPYEPSGPNAPRAAPVGVRQASDPAHAVAEVAADVREAVPPDVQITALPPLATTCDGALVAPEAIVAYARVPAGARPEQIDALRRQAEAAIAAPDVAAPDGDGAAPMLLSLRDEPESPLAAGGANTLHFLAWRADRAAERGNTERTAGSAAQADARRWRGQLSAIPGIAATWVQGPGERRVELRVAADDLAVARRAADALVRALSASTAVRSIALDAAEPAAPEIDISLTDHGRALGVTHAELARQLRAVMYGVEAARLQRGTDEITVIVRYPDTGGDPVARLADVMLAAPGGGQVPLTSVADIARRAGVPAIHRVDGRRGVPVTAVIADTQDARRALRAAVSEVRDDISEAFADVRVELALK